MLEQLKNIFEIKDIVWFIIGFALPFLGNLIKDRFQTYQMRRKIKKGDMKFADSSIMSLAHGDPFFLIKGNQQDLKLDAPQELFYISMPQDIKQRILENHPNFFNTTWETDQMFLDKQTEDEMLLEIASILHLSFEQTKEIYLEEKINVANLFLEKAKAGEPYFIGEMYGIKKLIENRIGEHEKPTINIRSYKTDYYTHRVMAAIYRRIYQTNPNIAPGSNAESFNKMRYFLTSMGMNVLLYLKDENKIVFAKRSGKLINMTKPMWHVSMNEAISITDISETNGTIDLQKCIERGLNEELGFDSRDININYSDLFFLKDPFETGISAFVTVNNWSFSDLQILYSAAKDKELESEDLVAIHLSSKALGEFMKNNDLTEAAQYLIKMLLARHLKGSI